MVCHLGDTLCHPIQGEVKNAIETKKTNAKWGSLARRIECLKENTPR